MTRAITPSSAKMALSNNAVKKYDFPFEQLEVGNSFGVEAHEITLGYLRSMCTVEGHKLNKTFKVIDHGPNVKPQYEVGRIEYKEPKVKKAPRQRTPDELEASRKWHEQVTGSSVGNPLSPAQEYEASRVAAPWDQRNKEEPK